MSTKLEIDYAFRSEAGVKQNNDDTCNVCIPEDNLLLSKGIAAAIADGVSSSEGGGRASQICVSGFLSDYFSTPESWSVKTSAGKVLGALNRWLYSQGQSDYDSARGMLTTFSGLVLKSTTAHICISVTPVSIAITMATWSRSPATIGPGSPRRKSSSPAPWAPTHTSTSTTMQSPWMKATALSSPATASTISSPAGSC
ncbi:hypothetical protein [endosymbiont of Ridgeia piscesae]|jgi:hypothetical protein|uniref:hypothetical protein n=1 Tax=endosymbiont of Ridgeia piscesae TaxID=54398 RepID=UPI001E4F08C9|nr:hypothetical protein [endosymbiont of Ridgeia piscesae]